MRLTLFFALVATSIVAGCNNAPAPPAAAPDSPPSNASASPAAALPAVKLRITAHGGSTEAAGPFQHPEAAKRPRVLGYRIEQTPGGAAYEVIEENLNAPERRAKIADDTLRALVAKATVYATKGCKMSPSPHNDPHVRVEGATSVDARGGIAQCHAELSEAACASCKDGFRELHAAILAAAQAALR